MKKQNGVGCAVTKLAIWLRWLAVVCLLAGATSSAFAAKTYSDNGDGTVTDPTTALQWMRCAMGQTWNGTTCTGTASTYTWGQANALTGTLTFAGHSDWRLPNIRELQTIVDRAVYGPATDTATFPNMLNMYFYFVSSTRSAGYNGYVWAINFHDGLATYTGGDQGSAYQVRLVRAGQSLGLLDIARPNIDYMVQGDGTVLHKPMMLTWQRCAIGQTWSGSTCEGAASTYTWDQAKLLTSSFGGKTDWRLPTEEELLSLVDYHRYYPATNPTLFPNAPSSYRFWSASPYAYGSDKAWQVYFNVSNADGISDRNDYNGVRLVRSGLSFGLLTLTVSKTGIGEVASSVMPGIECGTLCNGGYNPGDVVTLNATPIANFISWGPSGACSGSSSTCTVTMDTANSVTANFLDTPLISGLPSGLNFATQNIGSTSAAQQVTLSNTGTAALTNLSISASPEYAVSHNCGTGLGVGGFCTLDITFTPTASGARNGTVTVYSNAPGNPHTIVLTGTGQGSTSITSPTSLSFDSQGVGTTSVAKTVTLSNTGGAVLNIASIVANGDFSRTTTCGATLAQSASCTINVTFTPTTVGAQVSSLVITSDATTSPNTVSLSGTGAAVALVSLSPSSLDFATQVVNTTSSERAVSLTNTGGAPLALTSISASGNFSVSNNCGGGLAAGGSCSLDVKFTPNVMGARSGSITIVSTAVGSPNTLGITGTGTSPLAPVCTLTANPARIRPKRSSTLTATCTPAATSYSWTGGTCAGTTDSTCTVTPAASTTYSVTGINGAGNSTASAVVTVKAVDLTPILMLLLD